MHTTFNRLTALFAIAATSLILVTQSQADPLPGQVLKFDQEPMKNLSYGGATYFGHDELSTAYGVGSTAGPPSSYRGTFMADDFADNFSTPVVHLTWWGSYIDESNAAVPPQPHVQKFLIAFESDVPVGPGQTFSQPGSVLQYDVVDLLPSGPLQASSGKFTESVERPADPRLGETLYKYNAELHLGHEFLQNPDTVYWLKIAALVDLPQGPVPPVPNSGITQWGWHNRDYSITDPQAAPVSPNVTQGEFIDGSVSGQSIYHFQDDSVQGDLVFIPGAVAPTKIIDQQNMSPQNYVFSNINGIAPIDGPLGIDLKSKDLAFRLYTTPQTSVPEPAACLLFVCGLFGLATTRRRCR